MVVIEWLQGTGCGAELACCCARYRLMRPTIAAAPEMEVSPLVALVAALVKEAALAAVEVAPFSWSGEELGCYGSAMAVSIAAS